MAEVEGNFSCIFQSLPAYQNMRFLESSKNEKWRLQRPVSTSGHHGFFDFRPHSTKGSEVWKVTTIEKSVLDLFAFNSILLIISSSTVYFWSILIVFQRYSIFSGKDGRWIPDQVNICSNLCMFGKITLTFSTFFALFMHLDMPKVRSPLSEQKGHTWLVQYTDCFKWALQSS